MNPLFQQMMGSAMQQQTPAPSNMNNPIQRINYIRQAMANPAMFVKQRFPDIPDQILNNPEQILIYLQKTRGITNQDLQNLYQNYGGQL